MRLLWTLYHAEPRDTGGLARVGHAAGCQAAQLEKRGTLSKYLMMHRFPTSNDTTLAIAVAMLHRVKRHQCLTVSRSQPGAAESIAPVGVDLVGAGHGRIRPWWYLALVDNNLMPLLPAWMGRAREARLGSRAHPMHQSRRLT